VSDVPAADPAIGVRAQVALELHHAPDLGSIDPQVGLDVGGRLLDGLEVDTEQLGAALQGAAIGRVRVGRRLPMRACLVG
jgi:hypothetical protein